MEQKHKITMKLQITHLPTNVLNPQIYPSLLLTAHTEEPQMSQSSLSLTRLDGLPPLRASLARTESQAAAT